MEASQNGHSPVDPYDLDRFVMAQEHEYARALSELRLGRKRSHWMWYVFPQFEGLGRSEMSRHFAIKSAAEARAYLQHAVLGPRLVECFTALMDVEGRSAGVILGHPDERKLQSSATLFAAMSPPGSPFERVLVKYFHGERDKVTMELLQHSASTGAKR